MIQYLVRTSERIWETGKSLKYVLGSFQGIGIKLIAYIKFVV